MSSVIIAGDTSGAITLAAPSVAGTNTISLPAATGTVMVSGNMPAFSAYLSANQSVTTNVFTKVALDTKNFDTASCFDATTNYRFTPNVAGYYLITGQIYSNSSGVSTSSLSTIYKNGAIWKRAGLGGIITSIGAGSVPVMDIMYLNGTTDYVELWGLTASGSSPNFSGGQAFTYFSGSLVRAA